MLQLANEVDWRLPGLPEPHLEMSYRDLQAAHNSSSETEYVAALRYAHYLWRENLPARAVLALVRAAYLELSPDSASLRQWPVPYAPYAVMIARHRGGSFLGNPRISFEHQAVRMRGPAQSVRRTRAWAFWAITRTIRPDFPRDPRMTNPEPALVDLQRDLAEFADLEEVKAWSRIVNLSR